MIRSLLFIALVFSFSWNANAQEFGVRFNHNAIRVSNLEASTKFYTQILGLKEIENKTQNPEIRWFSLGGLHALHIITGDVSAVSLNKSIHMALSMDNFDAFVAGMLANGIPFSDWPGEPNKVTVRPDGIKQVYVQDPDGYWIEVNDEKI